MVKEIIRLLYRILAFLCGVDPDTNKIKREAFWTMIGTLFTVTIIWFGYLEFKDANRTTSAEFTHKIKNDFFTEDNAKLLNLFDERVFKMDTSVPTVALFNIDTFKYKQIYKNVSLKELKLTYSDYEVDELLQNFEDLGIYYQKGLVDLDFIYNGFNWNIETLWKNEEIQAYIKWQRRQPGGSDIYINFEYIYNKMHRISHKVREKEIRDSIANQSKSASSSSHSVKT